MFVDEPLDLSSLSENETLFCNCTSPWFGPLCRFTFKLSTEKSFEDIVDLNFALKSTTSEHTHDTCYVHLTCNISYRCLNWREICDRKIDCPDGSDEFNCWQLEINECEENEYRCHNGQCIPFQFFHDAPMNPDCMDRSDERVHYEYPTKCLSDPAFRCEEHTCRPDSSWKGFCGDGRCSVHINCQSDRTMFYSDLCSRFLNCFTTIHLYTPRWCNNFTTIISNIKKHCFSLHIFSGGPVLLGHIYFVYNTTNIEYEPPYKLSPEYICYNETLSENFLKATTYVNNLTCRHILELKSLGIENGLDLVSLKRQVFNVFHKCLTIDRHLQYCNHSTMYQCQKSTKCISKHRLLDKISDCPFDDDETFHESCSLSASSRRFKCFVKNVTKCFSPLIIRDGIADCEFPKDERSWLERMDENRIYFQSICDVQGDMPSIIIDGQWKSDEADCDNWPCNNTYTRCDRIWHCKNGIDEINCFPSTCSDKEHTCIFRNDTSKLSCVPIVHAGNGIIDCLGGTDERYEYPIANGAIHHFVCLSIKNSTIFEEVLCDNKTRCLHNDDQLLCDNVRQNFTLPCNIKDESNLTEIEKYLCKNTHGVYSPSIKSFKLNNMLTHPVQTIKTHHNSVAKQSRKTIQSSTQGNPINTIEQSTEEPCNRGVPIYIKMDTNTAALFCLCPPSYYGDQCQYQTQRISLTLQIQATSDWQTVLLFLITLTDDQANIESHDYVEYLPMRDCQIKFNVYLLYSSRPKNSSKNYSIHMHAFNKLTLNYRASWLFPIRFAFLPVYRLSVLLTVPYVDSAPTQTCYPSCIHGQCYNHVNDQTTAFCLCHSGWSGSQCNIQYVPDCARNSLSFTKSICICPLNRFGSRCYLHQTSCSSKICQNGGFCLPGDERFASFHHNKPMCICPEGYFGDHCEYSKNLRIDVGFDKTLSIPLLLLIHLITIKDEIEPGRLTLMKKIAFEENSVPFYTSTPFNIAFAQIQNDFFLIACRTEAYISEVIPTKILPSHRCPPIDEILNASIVNSHVLIRIKLYHTVCSEHSQLVCFFDPLYICMCDLDRQANCFNFDHVKKHDCQGNNLCQHDGNCFLDDSKCPTISICSCLDCYYGSRCQFTTKGATLSLDVILGYGIHPNVPINQQTMIVKIARTLSTIISFLGYLNNFFSILTFRSEKIRNIGCGQYLFVSSIISVLTITILIIKLWTLLIWQMGLVNNRLFIRLQCIVVDYLIRVLISSYDWLIACVAVERVVNVFQGLQFNNIKSRQYAKWAILILLVLILIIHIHDPISRRLIDDNEDHRTWCVTDYSSSLLIFDRILNTILFFIPFLINCLSAVAIITTAARIRSNAKKNVTYKRILQQQLHEHKHLLISPMISIVLTLPRLIISFVIDCMKSSRNPWLYLISYYISFAPMILSFIIFVLPSDVYKTEFKAAINRLRCH